MRNRILKVLTAWLLILCMFTPSGLAVHAADSTGAGEITVLEGAISQHFNDITTYRQEGALKAPPVPAEYEDYIFAGWYTDAECDSALSNQLVGTKITNENKAAYAKFVPKQVLGINAQIPSSTEFSSETSNIRFVTTVDSLRYQEVGFDFIIKGVKLNAKTTKVYKRLYAMDESGNKIKSYIPKHINSESEYFMACVVTGVKNKDFGTGLTVTPYWVTLDGTKVSAETVTKSVNMGYMSSMAEVVTKNVGEFEQPTDVWVNYIDQDPNYISAQGGCTDGTYYYQSVIHRDTADMSSEEFDTDKNESIIQKYSWSDEEEKWELSATSAEVFYLANANDITYNADLKVLVISHCGEPEVGKRRISFMDPETLTLVDLKTYTGIKWASNVNVDTEGKYIDCGYEITAIDYNALKNQYVVNVSGTQTFKVLNADFSDTGVVSTPTNQTASYSKQALSSDDSYVYYLFHKSNVIAVYDWNGNFVTLIDTDIDEALETENISVYNNKIYIGCDDPTNSKTVVYQVVDLQNFISDVTVSKDVLVLNDTTATDLYVETTIKATECSADKYPYTGLKLTNTSGASVDFVVEWAKAATPSFSSIYVTQTDFNNAEIDSTQRQKYTITSALDSITTDGIKLAVAKKGEIFYFYVNDVLQGTKAYEGFGAEDAVTAQLYSKYTTSSFSDYSVITTGIDERLAELHDIFAADTKNAKLSFDLLMEEDSATPKVTVDEKGYTLAASSIVNWFDASSTKFYAETDIELTASYDENGGTGAGIVLTSGENRFYVILVGDEKGITSLQCYSTTQDIFDMYDATNYPNGRKSEKTIALNLTTNKATLAVERYGTSLKVLVNGEKKQSFNLAGISYPMQETDASMVGLTGWKSQATFTNYKLTSSTNLFDAKDVVDLNEEPAADIYVETMVKVADTYAGEEINEAGDTMKIEYPHVGLRLANEQGDVYTDFVLSYFVEDDTLNPEVLAMQKTPGSETDGIDPETDGTRQKYSISSALEDVKKTGIKLAVAKQGETLYFYVNDVLQGTKTYENFGSDVKVTAQLYSKGTVSYFYDYSVVTTDVEIPMYDKDDIFVADSDRSKIYFDLLNEEDSENPKVTTNETGKEDEGSIVNWNHVSASRFYAETDVELTGNNNTEGTAATGMVLSSNGNRFFVLLDGTAEKIASLKCYSMSNDDFEGKVLEYEQELNLTGAHTLALCREGRKLVIFLDGETQRVIDLAAVTYPVTGNTKVGFAGWKAKATFTNYSIETGSDAPSLETYDPILIQKNLSDWSWREEFDSTNNEIMLSVDSTQVGKTQTLAITKTASEDVYAETTFVTSEASESMYPFTGLRLTSATTKEHVDFVISYSKASAPNVLGMYAMLIGLDENGKESESKRTSYTCTSDMKTAATSTGLKLAVAKDGDTISFYVNDIFQGSVSYDGFGADDKVTVSLYSKGTITNFYDYNVASVGKTVGLSGNPSSVNADTRELEVSEENEAKVKVHMTSSGSANHDYLYFNEMKEDWYAETYITLTGTSTGDYRAGLALKNETGTALLGIYLHAIGQANVTEVELFSLPSDKSNNSWKRTIITLSDEGITNVGRENIKFAVLKDGDDLIVYINDVIAKTVSLTEVTKSYYPISASEATYIGLNTFQGSATFYDYNAVTPGTTMLLAAKANSTNRIVEKFVISEEEANVDVKITGTSANHGYLYFGDTSTKQYAETFLDFASNLGDQRLGFSLKDTSGNQLGIYLHANGTSDVDSLEIFSLQNDAGNNGWKRKMVTPFDFGRERIKMAVLRDGDDFTVYINDNPEYTGKLSDVTDTATYGTSYQISETAETYIGLHVLQGAGLFYSYDVAEQGEAITLVENANSTRNVTTELVVSDATELDYNVTMNGTSSKHGYLYFGTADTSVYAKATIDLAEYVAATNGSNKEYRAGFALKSVATNGNILGIYLYAKNDADVTQLQIFDLPSDDSNNSWTRENITLSEKGITGVGRENIELEVYRDGESLVVYVNGQEAYNGTIADFTNNTSSVTKMDSLTNSYVGLNVMQQSATFSDFTYLYGDNVPTLSE